MKLMTMSGLGFGIQDDSHMTNPFVTFSPGNMTAGLYFVDFKRPAYLIGTRF